jgi:hypothetical protein
MRRLALALALLLGSAAPSARAVELEGYWYVLVHYQDAETNKPDQWRWDDRVWRFEKKGDRLEWGEWPIVVLDDETGRFEAVRGGRATRVLGKWEPSAAQLGDIRDGLQVNSRGMKSKTLRSEAGGTAWSSGEGPAADSALVVTYSETWKIAGLPAAPVFSRDDSMGSGVTESMSGRTVYTTENVGPNADEIRGRFERDGTRSGTFRMIRSGATEALKGAARDQRELQQKRFREAMTGNTEELRIGTREILRAELGALGKTPSEAELDRLAQKVIDDARRTGDADAALREAIEQLSKEP